MAHQFSNHRPSSLPPRHRSPIPSPAILTFLATLCADTVSAASPFYRCPDFLCPPGPSAHKVPQPSPQTKPSTSTPSKLEKRNKRHRNTTKRRSQDVPTKFEQGSDGRWRPATNWSLHGQSVTCAYVSSSAPSPSPVPSPNSSDISSDDDLPLAEDDTLGGHNTTTTSTTSPQPTPNDLPQGWTVRSGPARSAFYSVPFIVVFSLCLAVVIALLISLCAFRRIKRKRRIKATKEKWDPADDEIGGEEDPALARGIKKKKKVWARSTAHWKLNARLSMKRRRGRGGASLPAADSTVADSSSSRPVVAYVRTPESPGSPMPPPANPSTVPDIVAEPERLSGSLSSPQDHQNEPPAYRTRRAFPARAPSSSEQHSEDDLPVAESVLLPREKASAMQTPGERVQHSMHVATDDKVALAQMAASAGAPESYTPTPSCQARAPPWMDDTMDELPAKGGERYLPSSPHMYRVPSPPPVREVDISRYLDQDQDIFLQLHEELPPSAPPEEHTSLSFASAPMMDDLDDPDDPLPPAT